MCDFGVTAAVIAIGGAAASAGMSAYSAHQQGVAAKQIGEYNAQVAEQQAKLAEYKAQDAEVEGANAEVEQRRKLRLLQGQQRAAMSGSGAVVDSGSFGDILDDTVKTGEMDIETLRSNFAKKAWGYREEARMDRIQGGMDRYKGQVEANNAKGAMWGSLLTGASNTFGMAYNLNKSGAFKRK